MEKPDVDRIEGICPSIAIRQKNSVRNPRSTVGTVTEIHDYMRLLFARVGRTFCRQCGQEVDPRDRRGRRHAAAGAAGGHAAAPRLRPAAVVGDPGDDGRAERVEPMQTADAKPVTRTLRERRDAPTSRSR